MKTAIKNITLAFVAAASLTTGFAMAENAPATTPAKPKVNTDLFIEGGVDRTKMTESWKRAHENDVIGMANPGNINGNGAGYPELRK
jgi:hypothetical protein